MTMLASRISDFGTACAAAFDAISEAGGGVYLVMEGDNHRPPMQFAKRNRLAVQPVCTLWTEVDHSSYSKE